MENESTVPVWDILIRLFHWSLLVSFTIAYFTAEENDLWHIYSGYTVLGLITFRIFWGFIGSTYARFSNFIYSPSHVVQYIKSLLHKNPKRYLGHNPAAGYMVIALLLSLFVVTLSGLKLYAVEEGLGPLAQARGEFTVINRAHANGDNREEHEHENEHSQEEEFWEEIHEASTNFTLLLIFLHIAGVLVSSRLHSENLVKAMITGKKKSS